MRHVRWVVAADGAGTYQSRHSQQRRRRPPSPSVCVIHRRSHGTNVAASFPWDYVGVALLTAARWISNWPPPKGTAPVPEREDVDEQILRGFELRVVVDDVRKLVADHEGEGILRFGQQDE